MIAIDHKAEALTALQISREQHDIALASQAIARAHVHATLALVEQQRIANLIELGETHVPADPDSAIPFAVTKMRDDIRQGLGL